MHIYFIQWTLDIDNEAETVAWCKYNTLHILKMMGNITNHIIPNSQLY